ncbi:MAG: hypothetical protein ACR2G5_16780, partial [Pyrinomonadaceae bacterium]
MNARLVARVCDVVMLLHDSTARRAGSVQPTSNNRIGGPTPATRNVISGSRKVAGSGGEGVSVLESSGNLIQNNFIGTNASGNAALPNASSGVLISESSNNMVGGVDTAALNVVSGNSSSGVLITGGGATFNQILGNYIGTNAAGTAAVPNTSSGVSITNRARNNRIGSTVPSAGNIIAFNLTEETVVFTGAAANFTISGTVADEGGNS